MWRPQVLIFSNLLAIILFASWLLEPARSLWLQLDVWTFWVMNNSLAEGRAWQWLWAITNNRAFDLVPAGCMLLIYGHCSLRHDRKNLNRYIAIGILLLLTVLVASQLGKAIPVKRPSATFAFPEALRISQLVPEIVTKDTASDSFPGDHGLILLLYAGFVAFFMPRIYGILAALMVIPFTLPRLMSGAHWLTDEVVGAIAVAAVTLSWLFATPMHGIAINRFEGWVSRLRNQPSSQT